MSLQIVRMLEDDWSTLVRHIYTATSLQSSSAPGHVLRPQNLLDFSTSRNSDPGLNKNGYVIVVQNSGV